MEQEWPVITFIIITLNFAVLLFSYDIFTNTVSEYVIFNFGLSPAYLISKPYVLITHMFIHGDAIHFMGNIFMLAIVGLVTEQKLGSSKFLIFYFLSGLCAIPFGFLMEYLTNTVVIMIGASGAIFGVMFIAAALSGWEEVPAILIPILNIIAAPIVFFTLKNIKVPLFIAIIFYFLMNLVMMLVNLPDSIGELAHFGGIVGGVIGLLFIAPEKMKSTKQKTTTSSQVSWPA